MKLDNKTFQQKYEAWKNGADYWRDIRGINLGGDTQAEEPSAEEQLQIDQKVQSILNSYDEGKDVNIAEDIIKPLPFDTPLNEEHPILHKYKGGKDNLPIRSYKDFKNKLSRYWKEDISTHDYDYRKYYNDDPKEAYRQLNSILGGGHGHFPDGGKSGTYKKPSHPTYPDLGDESWNDNETVFRISDRQASGNTDRTLDYLGSDLNYNNGATKVSYEGGNLLPAVYVTPKGNYSELVPNKLHTGWVYEDSPLRAYKGGKNDPVNTFVYRMGPLVGQQLNRYGYGDETYYNVMRQLAYESDYGRSKVAKRQHNYGGVGWNGKTYNTYKSDEDFVKDYVRLMHNRYGAALRAKSTQDYARALKQKGYYEDSLENYSRNLRGMNSLVKAAYYHKNAHKDAYNYKVNLDDLTQDYEDARNASPIIINSPSTKQPSTIRADVPTTLIGPTEEEVKARQQDMLNQYRQQMYDKITSPTLPSILNMLPQNNFGKDSYGQKFWQRRGNNLKLR